MIAVILSVGLLLVQIAAYHSCVLLVTSKLQQDSCLSNLAKRVKLIRNSLEHRDTQTKDMNFFTLLQLHERRLTWLFDNVFGPIKI